MFSNVFNVCVCCKSLYFTVRYTKDCEGRLQDSEFYSAVYLFNQDLQLSLTTSVPCIATSLILDPEVIRLQQIQEVSELQTTNLCRESYIPIFVFKQAYVGESHFHGHHITVILTSGSAIFSLHQTFQNISWNAPQQIPVRLEILDITANGISLPQCQCFFQI